MKLDKRQYRSNIKRVILSLGIAFLLFIICTGRIYASELVWKDYLQPIYNIKVCHNEVAKISVNLPEDFLRTQHEVIKLSVTVVSRSSSTNYDHFFAVEPSLKINNAFLAGRYIIPVIPQKNHQTHIISIKRKDFNEGLNVIKATFRLSSG